MREEFHADLGEVNRLLVTMAEAVRAALGEQIVYLITGEPIRA